MTNDVAAARFANMSNEELQRVVTDERDDYVPDALQLAHAELARRSERATSSPYRGSLEEGDAPASEDAGIARPVRGGGGVVWVDVWCALLAMGAIGNFVAPIVAGANRETIGRAFFFGAGILAIAIGLRRRSAVAWWLNWCLIAFPLLGGLGENPGFGFMVIAMIPAGYCFYKHRAQFGIHPTNSD